MKSEKTDNIKFHVKYCWNCCNPIFYDHFVWYNSREDQEHLTRLWNNPFIRILCCSCYRKGLSEFTPAQLEIKSFIESSIGSFKYVLYFGALNTRGRDEVYQETIPGKNMHFSIAKRDCRLELMFREKFSYTPVSKSFFQQLRNRFYHEHPSSIISKIIPYEGKVVIELPSVLAPAIFSSRKHGFIALLAPILVDGPKKNRYRHIISSQI